MDKIRLIREVLEKYSLIYVEITTEAAIDVIYDLWVNGTEPKILLDDDNIYFYFGSYFRNVMQHELAIKYYSMAVDKGNCEAMVSLGHYYYTVEENYDLMKKYYLMAAENKSCKSAGNIRAMRALAHYYRKNEIDYELMIKYYLMAIECGDTQAMIKLADYYEKINKELAEKYYLMAIEKGDSEAMNYLGLFYEERGNYDLAEKYYQMAAEKGYRDAMYNLGLHYEQNQPNLVLAKKYFMMAAEQGDTDAMYDLGCYYVEIDKEFAVKYLLMGAGNESQVCIDKINNMLTLKFDVGLAIKAHAFLDEANLNELNKIISLVLQMTNDGSQNQIVYRFCCMVCKENDIECVFLKCGHPVCFRCYRTECALCQ